MFRNLLRNPLMRSCLVEVGHVGIEDALELLLLQDQQVIETLAPHTTQKAFTDRIGSGRVIRGLEKLDATGPRHPGKVWPKLVVVITYQILWCLPIGGCFSQVLRHPGIGRRVRHSHVNHLARLQLDHEEDEEWSKEEISDLQEITFPDLACVVAQKGRPLLTSWLASAYASHVLLDGPLAHTDAQFQQFSCAGYF